MIMKHPTPDELVSWVYGESNAEKEIRAHMKECAQCRAQVETWRGTGKILDELPAPVARRRFAWAPLQWAAVAAVFLALGIVLGRFAYSSNETNLRAAMLSEMQEQVAVMRADLAEDFAQRQSAAIAEVVTANTEKLAGEFSEMLEQTRAVDRATYLLALKELNAKYDAEVAALKKGLETVVALADYGFEATEQRFAQLAASTQNSPQE